MKTSYQMLQNLEEVGKLEQLKSMNSVYTLEEYPLSLKEVISLLDAELWQEAINDEMDFLESNKTRHLVDLSHSCKLPVVFGFQEKELKPDGTVDEYKALLVVKGFRQRKNIVFFDTYSPVTRIISIRVLVPLAAVHNSIVLQMDVKVAFFMVNQKKKSI